MTLELWFTVVEHLKDWAQVSRNKISKEGLPNGHRLPISQPEYPHSRCNDRHTFLAQMLNWMRINEIWSRHYWAVDAIQG